MFSWLDGAVAKVTGGGAAAALAAAPDSTTNTTANAAASSATPSESAPEPAPGVLTSLFGTVASVVQKTVVQIQQRVEESGSGTGSSEPPPPPPWSLGAAATLDEAMRAREAVLKAQILNLSEEKWTFLQAPAAESLEGFDFSMDAYAPLAQECLKLDPQLEKMRWLLVPWKIKEEPFWRNYFGHVYVVKSVLLDGHWDDLAALTQAGAPVHEGRRRTTSAAAGAPASSARPPPPSTPPVLAMSPIQLDAALANFDDDADARDGAAAGSDSVVELSTMDGLSLEEQINAALADE